jgi:hypothetical protein
MIIIIRREAKGKFGLPGRRRSRSLGTRIGKVKRLARVRRDRRGRGKISKGEAAAFKERGMAQAGKPAPPVFHENSTMLGISLLSRG